MNEEEFRKRAIAAGYPPEVVEAFIEKKRGSQPQHPLLALTRALADRGGAKDLAGGALEGATLGASKHAVPGLKEDQASFAERHPGPARASKFAGALATMPLFPLKAGLLARAGIGGGAAGLQAFNDAEGTIPERLDAAKVPAAAGATAGAVLPALPGLASKVGSAVQRARAPFRPPAVHVAEGAGPLLADDAAAKMAMQEKLAPGTTTPVSVSPGMERSTRVIGANAPVARSAQEAAEGRIQKLQEVKDGMSGQYEALLGEARAPLSLGDDINIRPVIISNGMWPGDETIPLIAVQGLRNTISGKMETLRAAVKAGKGGGPALHKLSQQHTTLTKWLEKLKPEIKQLDKEWGVLSRGQRTERKIVGNIAQSRASYASSRVAGTEPGSPGASLPSKEGMLMRIFGPDRSKLAEEANRLLLQPGQIPEELLAARRRAAMTSQPYQPGLFDAFMVGNQTPGAMGLFGD